MGTRFARTPSALRAIALRALVLGALVVAGACGAPGAPADGPAVAATPAPTSITGLRIVTTPLERRTPAPDPTLRPTPLPTARPTSRPTDRPTPTPAPAAGLPAVRSFKDSYFGAGVSVTTYAVTGATRREILASIEGTGPQIPWTGRAEAVTTPNVTFRFGTVTDADGRCTLSIRKQPPVRVAITVLLPRWRPPADTTAATVRWWNEEIERVATHERVHVQDWLAAVRRMNTTVNKGTCAGLEAKLAAIATAARRKGCEFDMEEYGRAAGLTLEACLAP